MGAAVTDAMISCLVCVSKFLSVFLSKNVTEKRDFVDNSGEDDDFQLAKRYDLTSPFKRGFVPGF